MKKVAIFAFSFSIAIVAFAQDDEKHEVTQESTTSPVVVHEEVPKKIAIDPPITPVKVDTSKPITTITPSPNESKSDFSKVADQNTELILFGGAILAYLLLVWFLSYASRTPAIAMSITRGIYYIVGFPIAMTLLLIKMPKGTSTNSASEPSKSTYSFNSEAEKRSSHNDDSSGKESVEIQFQSSTGRWTTAHVTGNNTDDSIAHAMKNLERTVSRQGRSVSGHIRAIGKKSGRIYDIRG